jgi:hypothetical protein
MQNPWFFTGTGCAAATRSDPDPKLCASIMDMPVGEAGPDWEFRQKGSLSLNQVRPSELTRPLAPVRAKARDPARD